MNSKRSKIFLKGYTLTEMLIVLAIVSLIAAMSWAGLMTSKKNSSVGNACNEIASMINKTRNYALSGKKVGGSVPANFNVVITSNSVRISNTNETLAIQKGVTCSSANLSYNVPHGTCSGCPVNIICSVPDGSSKTIEVSQTLAICK